MITLNTNICIVFFIFIFISYLINYCEYTCYQYQQHTDTLYNSPASRENTHKRFDAFAVMGKGCEQQCIGGSCRQDTSKITYGVTENMVAPCVVYSIGGNNEWQFEQGILDHTPCDVHTFDCTGPITRFDKKPDTVRMCANNNKNIVR